MAKVKIVTDSNSGITQAEAEKLGISVLPMPFLIDGEQFFEDVNLAQEEFYAHLKKDAAVSTSQPAIGDVTDLWITYCKKAIANSYIFLCRAVFRNPAIRRKRLRKNTAEKYLS